MEMLHNQRLHDRGDTLAADDRIAVTHFQSLGFRETSALHFHNGLELWRYWNQHIGSAERLLRIGGCAVLPIVMFWRTMRVAFSAMSGTALRAAPFVVWLLLLPCVRRIRGLADVAVARTFRSLAEPIYRVAASS